ncbi:hypothetical protein [Streptomyces halobius]|uniref:Secreted protein n=1 Tax=Streptomyces halobius TaxID=2879846 RepID=A0ABY4MLT4_9ACTN|nr:hypothetical protein [Streptomyces halobius]UQA97291.1 hypothetical protein K9S39_40380 [Streptomyces halobius]
MVATDEDCYWSERDAEVKRTKVAAVVGGSVMALGAGSPAFAMDVDNALPQAQEGKQLLDSATANTQDLKNPVDDLEVNAIVGSLDKVTDTLKTTNDTAVGKAIGDTARVGGSQAPMIGGLPVGTPLG